MKDKNFYLKKGQPVPGDNEFDFLDNADIDRQKQELQAAPRRKVTRRAFLGLGAVAALSVAFGSNFAWGGVGSGPWGAVGAIAVPGVSFGCKAGWSYSYTGNVWLAAACSCKVGKITELFVSIQVDAYVACGGQWDPTWKIDQPDTPTYAYIRDDSGAWLASQYWIIDTTYDHSNFEYMTGTSLRVDRRTSRWLCWCGADIKGLGGHAPGTHSIAEVSQIIPQHFLTNDASWQGKIVVVKPRAANALRMDVKGGEVRDDANVHGWENADATNQNWLVMQSPQGRTRFVPVHTGDNSLSLGVAGGVWHDEANINIQAGSSGAAHSHWLHKLDDKYYLIIPECSGCAIDLAGGSQANGTNIAQWNCYDNWNNLNQHWLLEEVVFQERVQGTMRLIGPPEVDSQLTPTDPRADCIPFNFETTQGLYYRYTWYRGEESGKQTSIVQAESEVPDYLVVEADQNHYLTCVVKAYARCGNTPYSGEVAIASGLILPAHVIVRFFVDGETDPCYQMQARRKKPFIPPAQAEEAATKFDCAGFKGWYRDEACTVLFEEGAMISENLDLFAYNVAQLSYAMTDSSVRVFEERVHFYDENLTTELGNPVGLLPASTTVRYGARVSFERGIPAWYEDKGRARETLCAAGAYTTAVAEKASLTAARITRNTTVYLMWGVPTYDGIELS